MTYQKSFVLFAVLLAIPVWVIFAQDPEVLMAGLEREANQNGMIFLRHKAEGMVSLISMASFLVPYVGLTSLFAWIFGKPQPQKDES